MYWSYLLFFCGSFSLIYFLLLFSKKKIANYKNNINSSLKKDIDDLFLTIKTEKALFLTIICAIFIPLLVFIASNSLFSFLISIPIGLLVPRIFFIYYRKKRFKTIKVELPNAIVLMSNSLKAGLNITQAIERATSDLKGPTKQEFQLLQEQIRLGVSIEETLTNFVKRVPLNEANLWVTATNVALQTGGNLSNIYDSLSATMRDHSQIEGKIRSLTAQGKMQGFVVGCIPILLGIALYIINPESMTPFFTSKIGILLISISIFMELMGAIFIKKVVTIDV